MSGRILRWLSLALLAIGGISRALPLLDQGGRLLRQFPSEDGYLMLTIARNLALGHGASVSGGTILTNGTQPLATLLWAVCFWLAGGERHAGVLLVQVLELAIAAGGAWLLLRLGQRLLAAEPHGDAVARLAAAVWFASPVVVSHSMNCLESGLYVATVLAVVLLLVPGASEPRAGADWGRWARVGVALGVAFWARNDAVLLCLAVGLVHLAGAVGPAAAPFWRRVAELSLAAALVAAIALPWLAFNWLRFGSVVPVSGQAESMVAELGGNLALVPPKLLEYAALLAPIPGGLEERPAVVLGSALALAVGAALLVRRAPRLPRELRALFWVGGGYSLLLALFYGLYFGAPHFMSRYLLPTSPFLALVWAALAWRALQVAERAPALAAAGGLAALALALALNARLYLHGSEHEHFQVVQWVNEHVPDDVWVGAVQTGTLGFFHDRTINLDGKVNPAALAARRTDTVPAYVQASDIRYLVDWAGIATWGRAAKLGPSFEVIVDDPELNLAVLRRRDPH